MENIIFRTSLAYDAICVCALDENFRSMFLPQQEEMTSRIQKEEFGPFEWCGLSFSALSEILYSQDTNSADWSLTELKHFFETTDHEALQNGKAKAILNNLEIIEKLGFENYWQEEIRPAELQSIEKFSKLIKGYDLSVLFARMGRMKNTKIITTATVIISAMSHPISFSLSNHAFVYAVPDRHDVHELLSMIAHELMHGFASEELITLYRDFMGSCHYLRSTHRALIEEFHSGDEEEFVMAAEYYLLYKSGIMSKDELIARNHNRYGGNVPMALYLFELIHNDDVEDYNKYLIGLFRKGTINAQAIIPTIERMLDEHTGEEGFNSFYNRFFFLLQSCISVIRDVQTDDIPDLSDRMAALANSEFKTNPDRKVQFIKTERVIESDATTRKTLISENIKIEALTFATKQEAFHFGFPRNGANIGACPVEYEGETFNTPYVMNLTFPENEPLRAEFSFVCGNTRYLITAQCPDYVISYDEYGRDVIENYADEIITNVKKASEFILLLNKE